MSDFHHFTRALAGGEENNKADSLILWSIDVFFHE